jgi:peroxiredoxin Q/BCP
MHTKDVEIMDRTPGRAAWRAACGENTLHPLVKPRGMRHVDGRSSSAISIHLHGKDIPMTGHAALQAGDRAPEFSLPGDGGQTLSLASTGGKKLVLYFYPKDDTSGCTMEAKDFNALRAEFAAAGTEIIGVSPDSAASHDKFKKKYELGFALASDESKAMLEAYGVWVEKSMYGRKYMGVERTTFLIGADGRIAKVWPKVKVPGHAAEVLAAAKAL